VLFKWLLATPAIKKSLKNAGRCSNCFGKLGGIFVVNCKCGLIVWCVW